ncbi:hypothetical protein B0H16DRAFT_1741359 [Mycena metata]|uniref:Uncharacterized protein n=1 Tax=Mycena metata TaxID=1033252 RepID=A0AAD7HAD6_9AGAR|nr:hypothetical protein B0H16DRAFT_1741359 [Mycena metata]
MSSTDVVMDIVLLPLTIIRSVNLRLPTPRTLVAAATSPEPPASRPPSSASKSFKVPSGFFGPWFVTKYAILVMDIRVFDQSEDGDPTRPAVSEQADSPCFAASDYETIIEFLPLVPCLADNFRRVGSRFEQCRPLYFIVEGHNTIFTDAFEVQRYHVQTEDSTLGIFVFATRAEAEGVIESDVLIDGAAAQGIEGVSA